MAETAHRFVRRKSVKPFGSRVPELYRSIQTPREHRLVGKHEQISQGFCTSGRRFYLGRLVFHLHSRAPYLYTAGAGERPLVLKPATAGAFKGCLGLQRVTLGAHKRLSAYRISSESSVFGRRSQPLARPTRG